MFTIKFTQSYCCRKSSEELFDFDTVEECVESLTNMSNSQSKTDFQIIGLDDELKKELIVKLKIKSKLKCY